MATITGSATSGPTLNRGSDRVVAAMRSAAAVPRPRRYLHDEHAGDENREHADHQGPFCRELLEPRAYRVDGSVSVQHGERHECGSKDSCDRRDDCPPAPGCTSSAHRETPTTPGQPAVGRGPEAESDLCAEVASLGVGRVERIRLERRRDGDPDMERRARGGDRERPVGAAGDDPAAAFGESIDDAVLLFAELERADVDLDPPRARRPSDRSGTTPFGRLARRRFRRARPGVEKRE